ncbi:MAG: O-antigen ligase family protein [Pseudomonadales bacterium]|nr:O-antigen ligase family protein [Pseudomonadales bacterium]
MQLDTLRCSAMGNRLLTLCCVSIVLVAWAVPVDNLFSAQFQQVSTALCLMVFAFIVWLLPKTYSARKIGCAELVLFLFVCEGFLAGVFFLNPLSRLLVIGWWLQAILFLFLISRIAHRELLVKVLETYCAFAGLGAAFYILNHWVGFSKMPFDISQNHLAMLLILPFFFFLSRALNSRLTLKRFQYGIAFVLVLAAILLTQSRAVWLGVFLSFLLFLLNREQLFSKYSLSMRMLVIPGSILIVFAIADYLSIRLGNDSLFSVLGTFGYFDEGSIGGRIRRWTNALPLIQDHLFFGVGIGNWSAVFENYRHSILPDSSGLSTAVNTYIHILAETGLFGFSLFCAYVCYILSRRKYEKEVSDFRTIAHYSLIGWLVTLCFHSVYDFKITLFGFVFTCGFLLWQDNNAGLRKTSAPFFRKIMAIVILSSLALFVVETRFSFAQLEQRAFESAMYKTKQARRFLWDLARPFSELISMPVDVASLVQHAEVIEDVSRYLAPDATDLNLQVGRYLEKSGNLDLAIRWYRKALDRNASNSSALISLCHANFRSGRYELAGGYCKKAAVVNPHSPALYGLMATLDLGNADFLSARANLELGRDLLWERMGLNDFGVQSRKTVSRYYGKYREYSRRVEELNATPAETTEATLREVLRIPKLHKSLAVKGCDLYFSSNINARFNLWKINYCTGHSGVFLQTNDSHSPFRLRVSKSHLYYISDKRGDDNYQLYRLNLNTNVTSKVILPEGKLVSYELSSNGGNIALLKYSNEFYRLFISDSKGKIFEEVYKSKAYISDVAWHPNKRELLFVLGGNTITLLDAQNQSRNLTNSITGKFSDPVFSPGGDRYAYTLRTGQHNSSLLIGSIASDKQEVTYSTDDSLIANPVWLSSQNILVHNVQGNQVLLKKIATESGELVAVGPDQGVVYTVHSTFASSALIFVASDAYTAASIYKLPILNNDISENATGSLVLGLDWIKPENVILPKEVISNNYDEISTYHYPANQLESKNSAIIWLHGGSNEFSPRWHEYAQYFSLSGYDFYALNYSVPWTVERKKFTRSFDIQAAETEELIHMLAKTYSRVFLLGVSTGTRIVQTVLSRNRVQVDGVVEYSPIDDLNWSAPRQLPPILTFTGENDSKLNHKKRLKEIDSHRAVGSDISWVLYKNEGHDLRNRSSIESRIHRTVQFLDKFQISI